MRGRQLHVTDRRAFAPLRTAVELIQEFRAESPERFAWRNPPYEYEHDKEPIDILYGSDLLRRTIDGNGDVRALVGSWRAGRKRSPSRPSATSSTDAAQARVLAIPGAFVSCVVAGTMWCRVR